jgi:hypothetical protein
MTHKDIFKDVFPEEKQIGGSHYKNFTIQPYEFITKNNLIFFSRKRCEVCLQIFK